MKNKLIRLYKIIREKFHEGTRISGSVMLEYIIVAAVIIFIILQSIPIIEKMLAQHKLALEAAGKLDIGSVLKAN